MYNINKTILLVNFDKASPPLLPFRHCLRVRRWGMSFWYCWHVGEHGETTPPHPR